MNLDKIPSMKDLHTRYLKMSLIMHPDKNGGSKEATEEYQKLQNLYRAIGEHIVSNDKAPDNEEENDYIALFKSFNFDKKNKTSHTILIENDKAFFWKNVMIHKYGKPNETQTNGLKFEVKDFVIDNEEPLDIHVTLWIMPSGDNQSKLLIQSKYQYANDLSELPLLYYEVRKSKVWTLGAGDSCDGAGASSIGASVAENETGTKSKRGRPKQSVKETTKNNLKYWCKEQACNFASSVSKQLSMHTRKEHKQQNFDKNRQISESEECF